jgi:hypothetical protein
VKELDSQKRSLKVCANDLCVCDYQEVVFEFILIEKKVINLSVDHILSIFYWM